MKKNAFFSLFAIAALLLTSCLPDEPGINYSATFARIVTIDHTLSPVRFYCDYTNEVIETENIKTNDDLAKFDLDDVDRALVYFQLDAINYDTQITFQDGAPIEVDAVYNKYLPIDATVKPVYGFSQLQVENGWFYPYAWVSRGYLNIVPQVKTSKGSEKYLVPEAVSNDSLVFSLRVKYDEGSDICSEYACFDLRTLADTVNADAAVKPIMKQMVDRINVASDSVMVVVLGDRKISWPDTITKAYVPTNYFHLQIK